MVGSSAAAFGRAVSPSRAAPNVAACASAPSTTSAATSRCAADSLSTPWTSGSTAGMLMQRYGEAER